MKIIVVLSPNTTYIILFSTKVFPVNQHSLSFLSLHLPVASFFFYFFC